MAILEKPIFKAPAHSCDTHFHVIGDPQKYPYAAGNLRFAPETEPVEAYLPVKETLGFERMVLVQVSVYGTDNTCQLDAAAYFGLDNARVVVDIDENAIADSSCRKCMTRVRAACASTCRRRCRCAAALRSSCVPVLPK
jgi:predicted TIM-barrel fold metal-dependent hydrolase